MLRATTLKFDIILLLVNTSAALFMTGLIWFVQIVHYPLFDSVGGQEFLAYAEKHRHLTSLVVVMPMVIEICTALILASIWKGPDVWLLWVCFAMVVAIWVSTAFCSIPCHSILCGTGYSEATHHWLVQSNWVRTICWTARSVILVAFIYRLCRY